MSWRHPCAADSCDRTGESEAGHAPATCRNRQPCSYLLAARMPPHAPSRHHSDKVLHVAKGAPASVLSCMRYSKLEISHRAHRCAARPAVSARRRRSSSAAPDAATMAAAASFAAWDRRNLVNVIFFTRWAPPPHASACSVHRRHNGRRRGFCDLYWGNANTHHLSDGLGLQNALPELGCRRVALGARVKDYTGTRSSRSGISAPVEATDPIMHSYKKQIHEIILAATVKTFSQSYNTVSPATSECHGA